MPIWPFANRRPSGPTGHAAEIARLESFVQNKFAERDRLILEVRSLEAAIRILDGEISREPSPTAREIKEAKLNDLLNRLDGLKSRAERISFAIRDPEQLINKLKDLEVDRTAAVSAAQIDAAIVEFEDIVANRKDAKDALGEFDRIQREALAGERATQTPNRLLNPAAAAPIAETPEARREEQRERMRKAGLLQDE
jgi:hypothetical protein